MEQKMIERINKEIEMARMYFDMNGKNDQRSIDRISGMVEMLQIATDKVYGFDQNGVYEL